MKPSIESLYPNTSYFVDAIGHIEIGNDDGGFTSFIRAIDSGGMVWEGEDNYASLDEAFADLERGLTEWMENENIEIE